MTAFASDTLPPDAPADIRYLLARLDAVTRERDEARSLLVVALSLAGMVGVQDGRGNQASIFGETVLITSTESERAKETDHADE